MGNTIGYRISTRFGVSDLHYLPMHDLEIFNYLPLASLWTLWCFIHSFFISKRFLNLSDRYFIRFHRILYNFFAAITFFLLILYERSLEQKLVFEIYGVLDFVRICFLICSILIFLMGAMSYDMLQFAGIRQIRSKSNHWVLTQSGDFAVSGLSKMVRHPWYTAAYLAIWSNSSQWYDTTLIVNIIFSIYLLIGTILEERKLVIQFGESYRNYQREVPMFIPVVCSVTFWKNYIQR